jgi:Enoyl-CoA hydratase/isomerase
LHHCLKVISCSVALIVWVPSHALLEGSGVCSMSPMSLRLTLQLYQGAAQLSLRQVLQRDFNVCANYTRHGWDFWRGVRSKLVEKQKNAQWLHRTVEDVPDSLLQLVCREPDFCNCLDLNVVDTMFEGTKGANAGQNLVQNRGQGMMMQARL